MKLLNREIKRRYYDQLQDYRWREFSRSIIQATADCDHPNGKCWACGHDEGLQVHHLIYRDVLAWEYDEHEVRVLCARCHEAVHKVADLIWVAALRFEPHELELILKSFSGDMRLPSNHRIGIPIAHINTTY